MSVTVFRKTKEIVMVSQPRRLILIGLAALFLTLSENAVLSQPESPKAELPVLITSCGQSPGATMLKVIMNRLKFEPGAFEVVMLATTDDLKAKMESGTPYKTLIIVMGASLKGMGAAGISIDDELERTNALLAEAKAQGILVIGSHIEGMKRRAQGATVGDNTDELSIDAVALNSDLLLINKGGDSDRRFSIIAEQNSIPIVVVEKNLELLEKLGAIFKN